MNFTNFNEFLSINDIKRLGLPVNHDISLSDDSLIYLFQKKYQYREFFSVLQKDLSERLLTMNSSFQSFLNTFFLIYPYLYLSKKEDGSFEFTYDYKQMIAMVFAYYLKKYGVNIKKFTDDLDENFDQWSIDEICFNVQEAFLQVFKDVHQFVWIASSDKKEEVKTDQRFAKYFSKNVREFIQLIERPIALPVLDNLDKDRLLLTFAVFSLHNLSNMNENSDDSLENLKSICINYIERYLVLVDYLEKKSGKKYDFSFLAEGESISYSKLESGYYRYCDQHSELIENYREKIDSGQLFRQYLMDARVKIKRDEFVKAIQLRFELFPKGEGNEKRNKVVSFRSTVSEDLKKLLSKKHEALLDDKINFYSSTDYLWTLEEAQAFNGYRGHIYPNGKVIFDKFYRSTREGLVPAYDESVIVMDLIDFIELAPRSKTELMNLIRNHQGRSIQRIYHVSGWQKRVQSIIDSKVNEYDFDLIETLLEDITREKGIKTYGK